MNDMFDEYGWYIEDEDHDFFCGCEICEKIKELSFNKEQAKILINGLVDAISSGGDAGGPYCSDKEGIESALNKMIEIKGKL